MGYDSTPKGKRPAHRAALRFPERNARTSVYTTLKIEPVPDQFNLPPLQLTIPGFEAEIEARVKGFSFEEHNKLLDERATAVANPAVERLKLGRGKSRRWSGVKR